MASFATHQCSRPSHRLTVGAARQTRRALGRRTLTWQWGGGWPGAPEGFRVRLTRSRLRIADCRSKSIGCILFSSESQRPARATQGAQAGFRYSDTCPGHRPRQLARLGLAFSVVSTPWAHGLEPPGSMGDGRPGSLLGALANSSRQRVALPPTSEALRVYPGVPLRAKQQMCKCCTPDQTPSESQGPNRTSLPGPTLAGYRNMKVSANQRGPGPRLPAALGPSGGSRSRATPRLREAQPDFWGQPARSEAGHGLLS